MFNSQSQTCFLISPPEWAPYLLSMILSKSSHPWDPEALPFSTASIPPTVAKPPLLVSGVCSLLTEGCHLPCLSGVLQTRLTGAVTAPASCSV